MAKFELTTGRLSTPFPPNGKGYMAATTLIPDLVQVSKLDTQFNLDPQYTQHVRYVSSSITKQRRIRKEEKWKRERRLGQGGFGVVWLEQCIQGDSKGEVRAVKKVPKLESVNCNRELEAIALFSHSKVSTTLQLASPCFPYGSC